MRAVDDGSPHETSREGPENTLHKETLHSSSITWHAAARWGMHWMCIQQAPPPQNKPRTQQLRTRSDWWTCAASPIRRRPLAAAVVCWAAGPAAQAQPAERPLGSQQLGQQRPLRQSQRRLLALREGSLSGSWRGCVCAQRLPCVCCPAYDRRYAKVVGPQMIAAIGVRLACSRRHLTYGQNAVGLHRVRRAAASWRCASGAPTAPCVQACAEVYAVGMASYLQSLHRGWALLQGSPARLAQGRCDTALSRVRYSAQQARTRRPLMHSQSQALETKAHPPRPNGLLLGHQRHARASVACPGARRCAGVSGGGRRWGGDGEACHPGWGPAAGCGKGAGAPLRQRD